MVLGLPKKRFNVKFADFQLYCQPLLHDQRQIRLNVSLHRGNGRFEVNHCSLKYSYILIQTYINYYFMSLTITTITYLQK